MRRPVDGNAFDGDDDDHRDHPQAVDLMRRPDAPTALSAAAPRDLALVAGADGWRSLGDAGHCSKQNARLLHLFRPKLLVVNEDIRLAGRELARAVLGRIAGERTAGLQTLSSPDMPTSGEA